MAAMIKVKDINYHRDHRIFSGVVPPNVHYWSKADIACVRPTIELNVSFLLPLMLTPASGSAVYCG
jgi:hypothetical protein